MSIDGTPISDADVARVHAEEDLRADWQRRTVRVVAAAAKDAQDCRLLLSILGLGPDLIASARAELAHKSAAQPALEPAPDPRRTRSAKRAVAA
jgi:hypothetical protein